jgi:hypothetical protein
MRAAVGASVEIIGLRPVARELRLDPKSVKQFINGAEPRKPTRARLVQWYLSRGGELVSSVELATAAVDVLLRDVQPADLAGASRALVAAVRRIYEGAGAVPGWLADLEAGL